MEHIFKHDAFLCYSRIDKEFAIKLQDSLEKDFFRLNKKLRNNKEKLYIIRDETDFWSSENAEEYIQEMLKTCRHLIVLCSQETNKRPYWIDFEINTFKKIKQQDDTRKIIGINYNLTKIDATMLPKALVKDNGNLPLLLDAKEFDKSKNGFFLFPQINSFELKLYSQLLNIEFSEFILRHKNYSRNIFIKNISYILAAIIVIFYLGFQLLESGEDNYLKTRAINLDNLKAIQMKTSELENLGISGLDLKDYIDSADYYFKEYPQDSEFLKIRKYFDSLKASKK